MKTKLILIALVAILMSCQKEAQSSKTSGNYKVEFLFEVDGCKIYRFYDGRTVYFSDCRGKIDEQHTTRTKNSNTTHRVETLNSGR